MNRLIAIVGMTALQLTAVATPARADATVFVGTMMAGGPHPTVGVAWGRCPGALGFELELARSLNTTGTPDAPSFGNFGGSWLLQTPYPVHGAQFYGTVGFGLYAESLGPRRSAGVVATTLGGGAKVTIAGPLKLRLDYRLMRSHDDPDGTPEHRNPQRIYAALSLAY